MPLVSETTHAVILPGQIDPVRIGKRTVLEFVAQAALVGGVQQAGTKAPMDLITRPMLRPVKVWASGCRMV
jgi:hypothetical protein